MKITYKMISDIYDKSLSKNIEAIKKINNIKKDFYCVSDLITKYTNIEEDQINNMLVRIDLLTDYIEKKVIEIEKILEEGK